MTDFGPARIRPRWALTLWFGLAIAFAICAWMAKRTRVISWQSFGAHRALLAQFVDAHRIGASLAYILVYVVTALLLFPAQLWIILVGGFLFGFAFGGALSWVGALCGAAAVLLAARGALRAEYARRNGWLVSRIQAEFKQDTVLYMLALRWLPISPYAVANAVPSLLGASFAPFIAVAMVGVLPDVITYSLIGSGVGAILDEGKTPDVGALSRQILPILVAVGAAPLLALAARKMLAARHGGRRFI